MDFYSIAIVVGLLYFIPSINGAFNKKTNLTAIVLLNLFLGWTLVGWVVALIWSATKDREDKVATVTKSSSIEDLHKLAELKDKGLISEEEFNKKKGELLK